MFDTGQDYDLLAMADIDPNDIATLLKLYLRERELRQLILSQFVTVFLNHEGDSWIGRRKGSKKRTLNVSSFVRKVAGEEGYLALVSSTTA